MAATAIWVLPQLRLPEDGASLRDNSFALDREGTDSVLWGGLVSQPGRGLNAEATYLRFVERDRPSRATRDRALNTLGLRVFRAPALGRVDFEVEPFYQWGSVSAGSGQGAATLSVSATFIHADIGYSFTHPLKPRLSLRFDRASGDAPGSTFSRFDTLFGMRRAEIAPSGLYNSVGRANLLSPGVRFELAPSRRSDLFVQYRPLWLASRTDTFPTTNLRDPGGGSGRFAGHQMEARLRHWLLVDALRFEANLLYLAKGRFLRDAPQVPQNGNTRYGSLNLTAFF